MNQVWQGMMICAGVCLAFIAVVGAAVVIACCGVKTKYEPIP